MKILVFGGSGFLGSHVCDALTEANHEVTIFDNNKSSYINDKQYFIEGDILDTSDVNNAVKDNDVVYNFAGISDIDEALVKPKETLDINVHGCLNILDACIKNNIQRFIQASTIYVYSESGGFYRISKQATELYIEEYNRLYGLDFTILRYGTLYGRRADDRNSIHRMLKQALFEKKIVAETTLNAMREYIHVDDASKSSVEILSDEFKNQNVILTGNTTYKYTDMLEMIKEILGGDVDITLKEPDPDKSHGHYNMTPYSYKPKIGKKLVSNYFTDIGQGLMDCLDEIRKENPELYKG